MAVDNFCHLHVHSEYSVLDGAAKLEEMAKKVKALGQPAIALTDHGSMHGAFDFYKTMTKAGVKPIIGMEAYMAPTDTAVKEAVYYGPEDMRRHDVSGRGAYTHLTVLARTADGLRNLFKLHSASYEPSRFYYKPRIDLDTLRAHSDGLIVLSGCAGSRISTHLRLGQKHEAREHALDLKAIFGDNFYIEVMSHGITDVDGDGFDEHQLNLGLIEIARQVNAKIVATNDSHYVSEKDASVHDSLLCVQTRAKLSDTKRFRFTGSGFYIKSRSEMQEVGLPVEALDATVEIAEKVGDYSEVFEKKLRMPKTADKRSLRAMALESERFTDDTDADRFNYEMKIIEESGYEDYFKIKAEVIGWAKNTGIPIGPGRGSAGGSLVSYLVGITDIDPIRHGLLFERFLNPERVSLPDIDTDISDQDRDRFLEHLRETYGHDKVAQIMTLGTVGAKMAIKDANRVLGFPYALGEELVSYLPDAVFGVQPKLSAMPEVEGRERKAIVSLAGGLEGLVRNTGVHAAGVVVSPVPLSDVMPTWQQPKLPGALLTGFDASPVEDLGLVKMDFLGLRNLGVVKQCLDYLGKDWSFLLGLPLDDPKPLKMLGLAESDGVFQLDSDGMKRLLKSVKVDSFSDIVAVLALYRPGPMGAGSHTEYAKRKNGKGQKTPSIHEEIDSALEPILKETYGLIVYQEQVMAALQRLCGWSLGKADIARKAMGKKDHAVLGRLQPEFEAAMAKNGYSVDAAGALWAVLLPFADYAFNKSHSVGYGMLSYWTAYLKAHHPIEYMTALLTSVSDDPKRLPGYLEEVKRMGIRLLPPDVNTSEAGFTPTKEGIRYGLAAIKGFGDGAFNKLMTARPFKDLNDFYNRAPAQVLNIGVLRALIASGAMDTLEPRRCAHHVDAEELAARASEDRKSRSTGKRSLFRKSYRVLENAIESAAVRQTWELEHLGITLSAEKMVIKLRKALDEAEWGYVGGMLANHPGDSEVVLEFQGVLISSPYRVDIPSLQEYVKALTWLEFVSGAS